MRPAGIFCTWLLPIISSLLLKSVKVVWQGWVSFSLLKQIIPYQPDKYLSKQPTHTVQRVLSFTLEDSCSNLLCSAGWLWPEESYLTSLGLCLLTYKLNEHPNIQWHKIHMKITSNSISVCWIHQSSECALKVCRFHNAVMTVSFVTRAWDGLNSDQQLWETSRMLGQLVKLLIHNASTARIQ